MNNSKNLVVEDEEKIMSVVKSFLESKGFSVIPAPNGRKALELFEREKMKEKVFRRLKKDCVVHRYIVMM